MNEPAQKKKIQAGCTLRKLKAFGYIRRKQNILRKKKWREFQQLRMGIAFKIGGEWVRIDLLPDQG